MNKLYSLLFISYFTGLVYGQANFPPCSAFDTTGKDTIRVINSYSNSLYAGIDNLVEIKKIPFKNLLIECTAGIVMESEGYYNVIPSKPGYTNIVVYQNDSVEPVVCFEKKMRVLTLPLPYITIDRLNIENLNSISKKQINKARKFEVHLSDDLIDDSKWFSIKTIELGYIVGQLYATKTNEGPVLSEDIVQTLNKLSPGTELTFIFTLAGQGDLFKRLAPIKIKLL